MSARTKPPVPRIVVEVPVDELRAAQRLLKTSAQTSEVRAIVRAHIDLQAMLTHMLSRPRRLPIGGGA